VDLDLTPEQEAFREEVRAWLAANVPAEPLPSAATPEGFAAHREWERRLYEAGYAAISWPRAYGGRDADLLTNTIFSEEYARAGAPNRINVLGLGLAGPTLMVYGTDEQKARWLPGILSAADVWCQGFSEPDAGSDLAGLRTSAVREGNEYVVNGQKIWTSGGRYSDWMFALVRTDREAAKHKGISFLMIDMHSEGIEVRPIVQINGDAGFAEVFLTDVRVPVENLVGAENDGWRVAMSTLGFERGTGLGAHVRFSMDLAHLVEIVKAMGLEDDPLVRDQVARLYTETEVFKRNVQRTLTTLTKGRQIGPEASLNKLYWSEMEARIYETGMGVMGPYAELTPRADAAIDKDRWLHDYWYARAALIYAGTSEIQKNIIAERVLGLPKEARA
jgi:alkylation response protein AidB-like acyl-CoA dehydrogenase